MPHTATPFLWELACWVVNHVIQECPIGSSISKHSPRHDICQEMYTSRLLTKNIYPKVRKSTFSTWSQVSRFRRLWDIEDRRHWGHNVEDSYTEDRRLWGQTTLRTGDFEDKISTLVKECQKMYISQPTETLQITYILKCWQHISNKQWTILSLRLVINNSKHSTHVYFCCYN